MRRITRYFGTTVFNAIAITLIVFLSLDFIFSFIRQIELMRGDYTFSEALIYMTLTSPRRIYNFVPFACLIGCLAGLGILASSSELVVVRAAGVSTGRIVWISLRPALLFIGMALLLGEYVAPYSEQMAESRKAIALGESVSQSNQQSWNREANEFMHFDAVLPSGIIYGVSRYQFDDKNQLISASYSKQAIFQGDFWQEEGIAITHLGINSSTNETLSSRRWDTKLTPELINILVLDANNLSIRNLHYYIDYLQQQHIRNDDYSLIFWQKLLKPLATISLVLIAISFIFGPLRSVTTGQRIFTGVVFGVAFELVQRLLGPSSLVFGFSPLFAVLLPIGFCVGVGLYLLRRAS
jgi:lipopolysaccharide export system permease protein